MYSLDTVSHRLGNYILERQNEVLLHSNEFKIAININSRKSDKNNDVNNDMNGPNKILYFLQDGLLENRHISEDIKWSSWKIYFVNENLVPFESSNNHYGNFRRLILDPLVHNGGHLNLGPTVYTINEVLLTNHDKDHIDEKKMINEFESLLPDHFDLILLTPDIEMEPHSCNPICVQNEKIFMNLPVFSKATNICILGANENPHPETDQALQENKQYNIIKKHCPDSNIVTISMRGVSPL